MRDIARECRKYGLGMHLTKDKSDLRFEMRIGKERVQFSGRELGHSLDQVKKQIHERTHERDRSLRQQQHENVRAQLNINRERIHEERQIDRGYERDIDRGFGR